MDADEEQRLISQIADRLARRHAAVPESEVSEVVAAEHKRFDRKPIRDFVPLLVERRAAEQLTNRTATA